MSKMLLDSEQEKLLLSSVRSIQDEELRHDRHYTAYNLGDSSVMTSKLWGNTRVTVRTIDENYRDGDNTNSSNSLLKQELEALSQLKHPNILLLMGLIKDSNGGLSLVFEHIQLGSLFTWVHHKKKLPSLKNCVDILLQVTDALIFIHFNGFIHSAISSHSVQLVNSVVAKLSRLEFSFREGEEPRNPVGGGSGGWHGLHHWLSPQVLLAGHQPSQSADIYSFCALIWELCTGRVPWSGLSPAEVLTEMRRGIGLPLDRASTPPHLYHLMRLGLSSSTNSDQQLDLQEIRDMLLFTRREAEMEEVDQSQDIIPRSERCAAPLRTTPSRDSVLSRSCIQLGRYGIDRYREQAMSLSGQDFSFVSNPAKRKFFMAPPRTQDRQGLGVRSMSSLYSCSEGIDLSSGDSSPELRAISTSSSSCNSSGSERDRKSSDSGIRIRPSSDSGAENRSSSPEEENRTRYRLPETYRRKSALFASMRAKRDGVSQPDAGSQQKSCVVSVPATGENLSGLRQQKRSRSVPRVPHTSRRTDYETGIKPASHRLERHTPSCSAAPPPPTSATVTGRPDHVKISLYHSRHYRPPITPEEPKGSSGRLHESTLQNSVLFHTAQEEVAELAEAVETGVEVPLQEVREQDTASPRDQTAGRPPDKQKDRARFPFSSLWYRKPEGEIVKEGEGSSSPPRSMWMLHAEGGVRTIVHSLEAIRIQSPSSQYQTALGPSSPGGSFTTYQTPAEKVSDLLRRPLPQLPPSLVTRSIPIPPPSNRHHAPRTRPVVEQTKELQSIAAVRKAQSGLNGKDVELQTARILKNPTQRARLHTLRTSTPLDPAKQRPCPNTHQAPELRQSLFQTALMEAAASSEVKQTSSISPPQANKTENVSAFSRESFETVCSGGTSRQELMETARTSPSQLLQPAIKSPHLGSEQTPVESPRRISNNVTFNSHVLEITQSSLASSAGDSLTAKVDEEKQKKEEERRTRLPSRLSLMSCRSSVSGGSLPETEDLYFDDELHPSLERDPNMQLLLAAQGDEDGDISPVLYSANIFDTYDGESVLSMEIASTGPQSLRSEYNTDTELTFDFSTQSGVTEYTVPASEITQYAEANSTAAEDESARRLWHTAEDGGNIEEDKAEDEEDLSEDFTENNTEDNNNNNDDDDAEDELWGGEETTAPVGGCKVPVVEEEEGPPVQQLVM